MEELHPVDLTPFDKDASIARASERQHRLVTTQALRDFGLLPRIVGGTEHYDPDDILQVLRTLVEQQK